MDTLKLFRSLGKDSLSFHKLPAMFSVAHFISLLLVFLYPTISPLVQGEYESHYTLNLTGVAHSTVNCEGLQGDFSKPSIQDKLVDDEIKIRTVVGDNVADGTGSNNLADRAGKVSLGLFHRFSPCLGLQGNFSKPSIQDTLVDDELRIQTLLGNNVAVGTGSNKLAENLPDYRYGSTGMYVVHVRVGTPQVDQVLFIDTGSTITWVQCSSCSPCMTEATARFNPSLSSTYKVVPCDNGTCPVEGSDVRGCSTRSTCVYQVNYGDYSYTVGEIGRDVLMLSPTLGVQGFTFGCGLRQSFADRRISGLLGLGRDPLSLPYQTMSLFGGVFSYCLPASEHTSGHLTFGGDLAAASYVYVPMLTSSKYNYFYSLDFKGISVGGVVFVEFQTGAGSIIDSGTTFTIIPPRAYTALYQAFTGEMSRNNYQLSPRSPIGLACYNFTGLSQVTNIPAITLHISDMRIQLSSYGVFHDLGNGLSCLAFKTNWNPTTEPNVIGYVNQRQLEVVYDIPNSRIGFAKGTCV